MGLCLVASGIAPATPVDGRPPRCLLVDEALLAKAYARAELGDFNALELACQARLSRPDRLVRDTVLHAARGQVPQALRSATAVQAVPGVEPADLYRAGSTAASAAFLAGAYGEAADWARVALDQAGETGGAVDMDGLRQLERVARILRDVPPPSIAPAHHARVPAERDKVGLLRMPVSANDHDVAAIVDTGANLSVVRSGLAEALGVRRLAGRADVGSATQQSIPVELGVIDQLELGSTSVRHVPVLILQDKQLTFPVPGGYRIDFIIGLPVLRSLGRLEYRDDAFLAGSSSGEKRPHGCVLLRTVGSNLFVDASVAGVETPLHLDSGANASSLSGTWLDRHALPGMGVGATRERVGGAGGTVVRESSAWKNPDIRVGGRRLGLPAIAVQSTDTGSAVESLGVLGVDALGDRWILDFEHHCIALPGTGPVSVAGSSP